MNKMRKKKNVNELSQNQTKLNTKHKLNDRTIKKNQLKY